MAGLATLTDPARVRALNDALRRSFTGGPVMLTAGVAALPDDTRTAVLATVRAFEAFDAAIDPHGAHDFGALTVTEVRVFWKTECYDRAHPAERRGQHNQATSGSREGRTTKIHALTDRFFRPRAFLLTGGQFRAFKTESLRLKRGPQCRTMLADESSGSDATC